MIQLLKSYSWQVFFYDTDQKIIYKEHNEIVSIDLNTLQLETIFPLSTPPAPGGLHQVGYYRQVIRIRVFVSNM